MGRNGEGTTTKKQGASIFTYGYTYATYLPPRRLIKKWFFYMKKKQKTGFFEKTDLLKSRFFVFDRCTRVFVRWIPGFVR